MHLKETGIDGAFLLTPEISKDDRGTFARTFSAREFEQLGLVSTLDQCAISHNPQKGTLRGLHYQLNPFQEIKMVRCSRGAIFDVLVDLREESSTYRKWFGTELSETNLQMLYIPGGCAHGFITMVDNSEVFYQISGAYNPEFARGIAWNDPAFAITWPLQPTLMSQKDRDCPPYREKEHA
ncbi:MAG TPA: dTDP-4-dehydrorhamnose 3,5-epimerase [Drouetiella sp.]|jgi:dTDP-4-dehydrorhamnose 3,5-epimerase